MTGKLRRVLIAARFNASRPGPPTPEEIHAIRLAWEAAAAQLRKSSVPVSTRKWRQAQMDLTSYTKATVMDASSLTLSPQREALIPFNDLPARLKRLAALRARHSHHNHNITDLKFTDTVNRRNSLNRALRNGHLAQVSLYARMRRIAQIRQRPATVFIADNTVSAAPTATTAM